MATNITIDLTKTQETAHALAAMHSPEQLMSLFDEIETILSSKHNLLRTQSIEAAGKKFGLNRKYTNVDGLWVCGRERGLRHAPYSQQIWIGFDTEDKRMLIEIDLLHEVNKDEEESFKSVITVCDTVERVKTNHVASDWFNYRKTEQQRAEEVENLIKQVPSNQLSAFIISAIRIIAECLPQIGFGEN